MTPAPEMPHAADVDPEDTPRVRLVELGRVRSRARRETRTGTPSTLSCEQSRTPPDIETMREVVDRLLAPDAVPEALPPTADELDTLTRQLRGHLELLLPEVEETAKRLPRQSIPRYCALACAGEARERLRAEPTRRFGGPAGHARRLARTLNALCDHWETLAETAP
ncbi:DUF6415 family natural product biosynthesis protein [Streptomyces sp. NPDC019531]|uniref:DUF6415 family natural product biosynthesis protein n=1 Tax=Streptomyces sp. NPDC019531 TaxID=3365062 RepID=UPI00384D189D